MSKSRRSFASTEMVERKVTVGVNPGLGTQLARKVHEQAVRFDAKVIITDGRGGCADAQSLFELLSLGVCFGDSVSVHAEGRDAQSACATVAALLEEGE